MLKEADSDLRSINEEEKILLSNEAFSLQSDKALDPLLGVEFLPLPVVRSPCTAWNITRFSLSLLCSEQVKINDIIRENYSAKCS